MGIFNVFKKKKIESDVGEEKKGIDKPLDSLHPQHQEEFQKPFGQGITEPPIEHSGAEESPFPQSQHPNISPDKSSLDKLNIHEERRMSPPQFQQNQDSDKLILAKLETIKAQLDFLQQKFEKIEQQLKNKEETVRWR